MYKIIIVGMLAFANSALSPGARYSMSVKKDIEKAQFLKDKVRALDRSLCPQLISKSYSPCFNHYLKTVKIRSTTELIYFTVISVFSAKTDGDLGYDKVTQNIFFLDQVITLHENFDPANLHINNFSPRTPQESREAAQLFVVEYELLSKSLINLEKRINSLGEKSSRLLASNIKHDKAYLWKKNKLHILSKRWKAIKHKLTSEFKKYGKKFNNKYQQRN